MTNLDALNRLFSGWTRSSTMLVNPCATNGGIIDQTIATGEWFVIFNNDAHGADTYFFETEDEAVGYFTAQIAREPTT